MPKPLQPFRGGWSPQTWRAYGSQPNRDAEEHAIEGLLNENQRLREENARLRQLYRVGQPLLNRSLLVIGGVILCALALLFACLAIYFRG